MNCIVKKTFEPVKKTIIQKNKKIFNFYLPSNVPLEKIKNLISVSFPGYPKASNINLTSKSYDISEIVNKKKRVLENYLEIKVLPDNNGACLSKKKKLFEFKKKKEQFLLKENKKRIKSFKKNQKKYNPYVLYKFEDFMKNAFDRQKKKSIEKNQPKYLSNVYFRIIQFLSYFLKNHKNTLIIGIFIISIILRKKYSKSILLIFWNYFFLTNIFKLCVHITNKTIENFSIKKTNNLKGNPGRFFTEVLDIQIFLAGLIRSSNPFAN